MPSADPEISEAEADPPIPVVVGIGASAGGHEPLEHIFLAIPPDCNLSFVVVMCGGPVSSDSFSV